jgi:hypothetical protein
MAKIFKYVYAMVLYIFFIVEMDIDNKTFFIRFEILFLLWTQSFIPF